MSTLSLKLMSVLGVFHFLSSAIWPWTPKRGNPFFKIKFKILNIFKEQAKCSLIKAYNIVKLFEEFQTD